MRSERKYYLIYLLIAFCGLNAKNATKQPRPLHQITPPIQPVHSLIQAMYSDSSSGIYSAKKSEDWEILFDGKNTDKWESVNSDTFPASIWAVEHGTLSVANHRKGGDIITREEYSNFDLRFDFKLTNEANSGVKYFVEKIQNKASGQMEWNGPEYQIIDDYNNVAVKNNKHPSGSTASLYLIYAPKNKKLNPAGQWNSVRIVASGPHVEHWLNGIKVLSYTRGTSDFRKRMAATKFKDYDNYGELPMGHIMLTDHEGDQVYFRNIRIKRLHS